MMVVLVLLVILFTIVIVFGGVGALFLYTSHQEKKYQQQFAESARQIGLQLHGGFEAQAERDGIKLVVKLTYERRGTGQSRRKVRVMRYTVYHQIPLCMGLCLRKKAPFFGELFATLGLSSPIILGDPALDQSVEASGIDTEFTRSILLNSGITQPILAACIVGHFSLNDTCVFVQHDGWQVHPLRIQHILENMFYTSQGVSLARQRLRAPWESHIDQVWSGIAAQCNLAYNPLHNYLNGPIQGAWVQIRLTTVDDRLQTHIEAQFQSPTNLGLHIYRTDIGDSLSSLFGGQDIVLGAPEFDNHFTVRARDVAAVQYKLRGEGAYLLGQIARVFPSLSMDDATIRLYYNGVLDDPAVIRQLLGMLSQVAMKLTVNQC